MTGPGWAGVRGEGGRARFWHPTGDMVQGKLLIATIAREQTVALWLWSHKGAIVATVVSTTEEPP
jgi:hypothetical protein